MSKKIKYIELKKQFDDLIFEIVRTRTVNKSADADYLIEKIKIKLQNKQHTNENLRV